MTEAPILDLEQQLIERQQELETILGPLDNTLLRSLNKSILLWKNSSMYSWSPSERKKVEKAKRHCDDLTAWLNSVPAYFRGLIRPREHDYDLTMGALKEALPELSNYFDAWLQETIPEPCRPKDKAPTTHISARILVSDVIIHLKRFEARRRKPNAKAKKLTKANIEKVLAVIFDVCGIDAPKDYRRLMKQGRTDAQYMAGAFGRELGLPKSPHAAKKKRKRRTSTRTP